MDSLFAVPGIVVITRDDEGKAGYAVAAISVESKATVDLLVIQRVDAIGPARVAGLTEDHVGWLVTQVDGTDVVNPEHGYNMLSATKRPRVRFTLTVQPCYPPGSFQEGVLQSVLESH